MLTIIKNIFPLNNLDAMLLNYFELSFIMAKVGNLNTNCGVLLNNFSNLYNLEGYFKLSFITTNMGSLDAKLGNYFMHFP